jgi:hypothetical protein
MMNDKFAAQLRRHLVESADERPAEGQLAAIVESVATTRQRLPLVARLMWSPGRIGPVPTAAVRYGLLAAALAGAMAAGAIVGGGSTGPSTVFDGTWTSTDPADGSVQLLVVGRGNAPAVYFEDGYATGEACVGDAVKRFTARGVGAISGHRLIVEYPDGGGCGLVTVEMAADYTYVAEQEILVDHDGLIWTRALGPQGPVPSGPIPSEPINTPRPTIEPTVPPTMQAVDATFTSPTYGITIGHPGSWEARVATEPWTGGVLEFDSPAADVLMDPALGEDVHLAVASQPYGALSRGDWLLGVGEWLCNTGGSIAGWQVDGVDASLRACGWTQAVVIAGDDRGYVILLYASGGDPALALDKAYDWEWFKSVLATVDLRPGDASDAPATISSGEPEPEPEPEPTDAAPLETDQAVVD